MHKPALLTILLAFGLLALGGGVLPAASAAEERVSATEHALQLARAGQIEEAVRLLQRALATNPQDLESRLALAEIFATGRQNDKAEHEFREALRLHPASPSAEMSLAEFYVRVGSLSAAEQVLEHAVRQHPKLAEIRIQLALVEAGERKYAAAEANIRQTPAPADPEARVRYFRLAASIHSGLGDSHGAARAMEEALRVNPTNEQLQLITSVAEAEAGEWEACIRNLSPVFATHPAPDSGLILLRAQLAAHQDFASTLQSLRGLSLPESQQLSVRSRAAEILSAAGQHAEAAVEFQEALKIAGGHDQTLLYDLAVEQYHSRQLDAAFATIALLRSQKDSAEIEDLAGDIEEEKGDSVAAVHSYQSAVALAPEEEKYRFSLGAELVKYQTYEPAAAVFEQAAKLFPDSSQIYLGLGMTYYLMEKYDESVAAFLRAQKLDPESGLALRYLGMTQLHSATTPIPAAVDAICASADSGTGDAATITWCGALQFRAAYIAGDQSNAPAIIRRLRNAAKLAPDDPTANCSLGGALEWIQQLAEARQWMETCVRLQPDSAEDHYRLSRIDSRLGLTQAAAEQAELTRQANAEKDQHHTVTKKFVYDLLGQSPTPASKAK